MEIESRDQFSFFLGVLASLASHLLFAAFIILFINASSFGTDTPNIVFSVTLEGGDKLGGINQAPEPDVKQPKVLPNQEESQAESKETEAETVSPKEIETPTVVEDRSKEIEAARLAEEKRIKEEEKKKKAKELEKEKEKKRKAEEEQKKLEEKRKEDEAKKRATEKKERDAQLRKAVQNAAKRYAGESANAGGQGFGAAALGGKGMGGGQLQSLEFVTYRNALEAHIKGGWRWLPSPQRYRSVVSVSILPDGRIQDARIETSSGNPSFDDSALRAVQKASPVPPAPRQLYDQFFREIRMTFDSQE